jgi:hypothetical protein
VVQNWKLFKNLKHTKTRTLKWKILPQILVRGTTEQRRKSSTLEPFFLPSSFVHLWNDNNRWAKP